jgi:hypothetical protein
MRIAIVLFLLAGFANLGRAGTIATCGVSGVQCDGTFIDKYCFTQSTCTPPAGCGVAGSDGCPGRCTNQPWILCTDDSFCPSDTCKGTGTFGLCKVGSPRVGEACTVTGDCNDPRGGSCTVNGLTCCDLVTSPQNYLGDTICTIESLGSTSGSETITGTSGVDHICSIQSASGHSVTVNASDGDDVISTLGTADTINAGNGNDIVSSGGGNDTINGGDGDDILDGESGNDTVNGEAGNDMIDGGPGNDNLTGGTLAASGADTSGNDIIFGGDGNDSIFGNGGRDYLNGEDGDDAVRDTGCAYGICLASPDNTGVGSLLCGGAGNDTVEGWGPRHQCIDGGTGTDTCTYSAAFTGGRTVDSADTGSMRSCETVPFCGTTTYPGGYGAYAFGTCINPSTYPCGCE